MNREKIISYLIMAVIYAVFIWIGDKFIFDDEQHLYMYLFQGVFFALAMYCFNRFFNKKIETNKDA